MTFFRVGELAEASGLTVRTLHHYDEIGLMSPSERTPAGHRLYSADDVRQLYRIVALRKLGFSLDQIGKWLVDADHDPLEAVRRQREQLAAQMVVQRQLDYMLKRLEETLEAGDEPATEMLLGVIEKTVQTERYYSPEALARLQRHGEEIGEEAIRAAEAEWPELIAAVQAEYAAGTDPADPVVQKLAARWSELVRAFHNDDPEIMAGLRKMWEEQGDDLVKLYSVGDADGPPMAELYAYLQRAWAAPD